MINSKKKLLILIPIFIFFDQLSKKWMLNNIFDGQRVIEINKYLNFVPVWNKGISFGMMSDFMNINFFMIIITITISLLLILWFIKTTNRNLSTSLALIISGAIGNLFDRLNHKAVIDFIDIHIGNLHWPAFNLADSYITIGAFIYIYTIFTSQKDNIA
jgi:signal peptidase II